MVTTENIDINKYKLTFSVSSEKFSKGLDYSFDKNKHRFNVQGFRKGRVPRKIVEATYGVGVLFEDAINFVLQDAYKDAVKESNLKVVARPEIDATKVSVEDGVSFEAIVYTKPEVKISEYKGLECKKVEADVTKEDVEAEIKKDLEKHAKVVAVVDRPVKNGDIVNINFEGFIDDVAFEGGKGDNYDLEIGSKSFIDNFEEQLIGKKMGENVEVNVTFPENYGKEDLQNKKALFKVKINLIHEKQLPTLDDEFVQDTTEFESVKEYKKEVKAKLTSSKKQYAEKTMKEELLKALIQKAEINVPTPMVEEEIDRKINEFASNIQAQGISLDAYLKYMGQSIETMREAYRIMCEEQIKGALALEEISKLEKIKVTEKDLDNEMEKLAKMYNLEKDKLKELMGEEEKEDLVENLKTQKAFDFIFKHAVKA